MGDQAQNAMEMPRYKCHKTVWALEIETTGDAANDGSRILYFKDKRYAPMECPDTMFVRYIPVGGDFLVQYRDGYKSISPGQEFRDGYSLDEPNAAELGKAARAAGPEGPY